MPRPAPLFPLLPLDNRQSERPGDRPAIRSTVVPDRAIGVLRRLVP
jgi:hypothetical protein